jgi:hypothetical protein
VAGTTWSDQLAEAFGALASFADPGMLTLRIGDLERQLTQRTREQAWRISAPRTSKDLLGFLMLLEGLIGHRLSVGELAANRRAARLRPGDRDKKAEDMAAPAADC